MTIVSVSVPPLAVLELAEGAHPAATVTASARAANRDHVLLPEVIVLLVRMG
jgi:hypothetical protein